MSARANLPLSRRHADHHPHRPGRERPAVLAVAAGEARQATPPRAGPELHRIIIWKLASSTSGSATQPDRERAGEPLGRRRGRVRACRRTPSPPSPSTRSIPCRSGPWNRKLLGTPRRPGAGTARRPAGGRPAGPSGSAATSTISAREWITSRPSRRLPRSSTGTRKNLSCLRRLAGERPQRGRRPGLDHDPVGDPQVVEPVEHQPRVAVQGGVGQPLQVQGHRQHGPAVEHVGPQHRVGWRRPAVRSNASRHLGRRRGGGRRRRGRHGAGWTPAARGRRG